jgi:hypothetical protein
MEYECNIITLQILAYIASQWGMAHEKVTASTTGTGVDALSAEAARSPVAEETPGDFESG